MLMTRHFDYCPSASEGDNQSVRSSAPVVSRCFPGGYNVKLYISRGRLAWWLLAFLHSGTEEKTLSVVVQCILNSLQNMCALYLIKYFIHSFAILFSWQADEMNQLGQQDYGNYALYKTGAGTSYSTTKVSLCCFVVDDNNDDDDNDDDNDDDDDDDKDDDSDNHKDSLVYE